MHFIENNEFVTILISLELKLLQWNALQSHAFVTFAQWMTDDRSRKLCKSVDYKKKNSIRTYYSKLYNKTQA